MKDELVTEALYGILQDLSGCKYLHDWCLDAAISVWAQRHGKTFTDEQRKQLHGELVEALPKIGFQVTKT